MSPWSFNLFDALRFQVQVHPRVIGLRDKVADYELSLESSHDTETINLQSASFDRKMQSFNKFQLLCHAALVKGFDTACRHQTENKST